MRRFMTGKWLLTHALVIALVLVFLRLGWWQLGRGESGNIRSYAYALEWPTFALLVVGFWVKIMRDELHPERGVEAAGGGSKGPIDEPAAGSERDDDQAELAAFNRHVADLASRRGRQ